MRTGRRAISITAAFAIAVGTSACGEQQTEVDEPTWESASAMMTDADGTVRVTITGEIGQYTDHGGEPDVNPGTDMVVMEAAVVDAYGVDGLGATIPLLDYARGERDGIDPVEVGEELIVSYEHL